MKLVIAKMVWEAAGHPFLGGGKVLIMGDFNYREIDWICLDPHGGSDTSRQNMFGNFLYQYTIEHIRVKGSDTLSILVLIFT